MPAVIFYEKPGCISNNKQKRLLLKGGAVLEVKNLLTEAWDIDTLKAYFSGKPKAEWVNTSAPAIKSGHLKLEQLSEIELLEEMIRSPILIRRPLIQYKSFKTCGFNQQELSKNLNVNFENSPKNIEACSSPKQVSTGCRQQ